MDLNLRTFSLKNRILVLLIAAALFLTGVAPSFADEAVEATEINWEDAPDIMATSAVMIDAEAALYFMKRMPTREGIRPV